jgi:hypothetical protein
MKAKEHVWIILFGAFGDDCPDCYAYRTRKSALKKANELMNASVRSCGGEWERIDDGSPGENLSGEERWQRMAPGRYVEVRQVGVMAR